MEFHLRLCWVALVYQIGVLCIISGSDELVEDGSLFEVQAEGGRCA